MKAVKVDGGRERKEGRCAQGEGCGSGGERYIGVLAKGRGLPPKASETKGV